MSSEDDAASSQTNSQHRSDDGGFSSGVTTPRAEHRRLMDRSTPHQAENTQAHEAQQTKRRVPDLLRHGQNVTMRCSVVEEVDEGGLGSRRQSIGDDDDDDESPLAVTYPDIPFAWSVNFNTPFDPSAHEPINANHPTS